MPFKFALTDLTGKIPRDALDAMSGAAVLLGRRLATGWMRKRVNGLVIAAGQKPPPGHILFSFVEQDDQTPGALGWHDESSAGAPYAELLVGPILDNGGGVLDLGKSGYGLASVFFHELAETLIDPYVDDWVQMPDGVRFLAKEASDPVEGDSVHVVTPLGVGVDLSNAVLPRYFDIAAPTDGSVKFDLAGLARRPFELRPGGYQIVYDPRAFNSKDGPVTNIFGASMPPWRRAQKAHPRARAMRRKLRHAAKLAS